VSADRPRGLAQVTYRGQSDDEARASRPELDLLTGEDRVGVVDQRRLGEVEECVPLMLTN